MFIETLEFTIPMDLCDLFSTMKRGPRSNLEFPASVNSYGTTQDANIQVVVRSNKLTFKVDGVSSDASMISKSECKTLKLSVFDVDRSLMPLEEVTYDTNVSSMQYSTPSMSAPVSKRLLEHEQSVSLPPAKSSRTSYSDSPRPRSPTHRRSQSHTSPRVSENSHSKSNNDTPVNVKQEPEDPDLIEVEPDDIEPKRETPYMQIDYSSDVPHTQTSQAALERLSHPQSSHSQSPASSSSSFHQNVPHVPDYSDPGPSRGHPGDQTTDDFLVFQDDNEDGDDNEADYSNDDYGTALSNPFVADHTFQPVEVPGREGGPLPKDLDFNLLIHGPRQSGACQSGYKCELCGKVFTDPGTRRAHKEAIHDNVTYSCPCGRTYKYRCSFRKHRQTCPQGLGSDPIKNFSANQS